MQLYQGSNLYIVCWQCLGRSCLAFGCWGKRQSCCLALINYNDKTGLHSFFDIFLAHFLTILFFYLNCYSDESPSHTFIACLNSHSHLVTQSLQWFDEILLVQNDWFFLITFISLMNCLFLLQTDCISSHQCWLFLLELIPLFLQPMGRFQGQATDVDILRTEVKHVKAVMVNFTTVPALCCHSHVCRLACLFIEVNKLFLYHGLAKHLKSG